MKKKLSAFLLILVLCLSTVLPAFGSESDGFADAYPRVIDMADLLSDSESEALIEKLDEISIRQRMDVVVLTTTDLQGFSLQGYSDSIYESCEFGYGYDRDGLILVIDMSSRDWYISTCGYGIIAFTDAGISYIGEQISPELSDGDYAAAFTEYAELCDTFITQARNGESFDSGNLPKSLMSPIWIPVSVVIGFIIAIIAVGRMKAQLKTVRARAAAADYVRSGSMSITESREMFLYHTVTRKEKPKKKSSGSSTHHSSSGTTHGGGGGKF